MTNLKFSLIISTLFFFSNSIKADIPIFDVITISHDQETYHIQYTSMGILKEDDLAYYNNKGEVIMTITEIMTKLLKSDSIQVFKQLHIISTEKLIDCWEENKKLFVLKEPMTLSSLKIRSKYKIQTVERGNTYGYTWTAELNEEDNYWLRDYPIEILFRASDYEICEMTFYGIQGNLPAEEINAIKLKIEKIFKEDEGRGFKAFLSELYKRNIIMIGHCSC